MESVTLSKRSTQEIPHQTYALMLEKAATLEQLLREPPPGNANWEEIEQLGQSLRSMARFGAPHHAAVKVSKSIQRLRLSDEKAAAPERARLTTYLMRLRAAIEASPR